MIEKDTRDIFYVIVPDRTQETFTSLFWQVIEVDTLIITDSHASCPGAVRNNGNTHQVINHSRGFQNIEGCLLKNIENLWEHVKYDMRKRRGILKVFLMPFLQNLDLDTK